jgi:ABC-type branched-subunit amino acid transport system ATPase component/predicted MFS family arabinose efflux permease
MTSVSELAAGIIATEPEVNLVDDTDLAVAPDLAGEESPGLRATLARYGALPLVLLTILNLTDELDRVAIVTLGPEIQRAFHISDAALGAIAGVGGLLTVAASVPIGVLGDRRRRVPIVGIAAIVWAAFTGLTGLVRNVGQLTIARLLSGLGKGSIEPVHTSLLADWYPVNARGRVLAFHRSANPMGLVLGPLLAGGIAAVAGWRWAFFAAVPLTLVPALLSLGLKEPRRGQHEEAAVVGDARDTELALPLVPVGTAIRRLMDIQSLRYMFIGIGVLGFAVVGAPVIISLYLEEQLGLGEVGRGAFFAVGAVGPLLGTPLGGAVADRLFRKDPGWPLHLVGLAIPTWAVIVVVSLYLPGAALVAAGWVVAGFVLGLATPAFLQLVSITTPPAYRGLSFSMFGIYLYVFGGFFGPAVMGAASDAWGPRAALTLLLAPGLLAGVLLVRGAKHVAGDIQMVVDDLRAQSAARERRAEGRNLVELRGVDFAYGQTQVLFGVDLDIPEGEIVALLGTNGAGKSTVLRVLTGLDHPKRGQVRFRGEDITYLEAEQILSLGIAQMPGGKAVFPGMTVEENLRVGAFTYRTDKARVEADLDEVYARFPLLGQRRRQLASTLSGGEQQMLALSKAFLTKPALLCIDELSLGLAPAITAELLDIVRELHARGTTIVVVEQSVNVALALATTAVFMEKGQVRYAGPAEALRDRSDLLRSVFLSGAVTA